MRGLVCLLLAILAGCTGIGNPAAVADSRNSVSCRDRAECDRYWQRARQWVTENSPTGIRNETKWAIVAEYPTEISFKAGYSVTKTENGDGGGVIAISVACATFVPCIPSRETLIGRFKQYVTAP